MKSASDFNELGRGKLPDLIGVSIISARPDRLISELETRPELLAPNGYLHAASVIALADTTCGYGTRLNINEVTSSFTTMELKSNFLGTARDGVIRCEASPVHIGSSSHVWDASVKNEDGKTIALFRCTQMILRKR